MASISSIDVFGKWIMDLNARDKICKVVQYGSKGLGAHWKRTAPGSKLTPLWPVLEITAGNSRKMFRLGKWINTLINMSKNSDKDPMIKTLSMGGDLGLALFFFFDNVAFLSRLGVLRYNSEKMYLYSSIAWMFDCVLHIIADCQRLTLEKTVMRRLREKQHVLLSKLTAVHAGDRSDETGKALEAELGVVRQSLVASYKKQKALTINIVKNFFDLQPAICFSFPNQKWAQSPRYIGLCGAISAALAASQSWPK
eukprot:tig00000248_g21779.t1